MFGQPSRAVAVAKYMLDQATGTGLTLTPMQLLKLVYIAHGWMLGKYGRPLFPEQVQAWQYGPVVPSVYQAVKQFGSNPIAGMPFFENNTFDAQEMEIMNFVVQNYGQANGIMLSAATHQRGTPWDQTWSASNNSAPISNDLIRNFYANLIQLPSHSAL
jgi:uncharacterized phage-associated protein